MPIKNVVVNCTDVQRSVEYYTKFLELPLIGEATPESALLDAVSATIELRAVGAGRDQSTWVGDDLQKGFRHIGFKVDRLDERAEVLKAAGVEFKLDPLDAEGKVRICFFFDPDGTLLEMIQGDLQYAAVMDPDGVARERALGVPQRPRFDHIAVTIEDRDATHEYYRQNFGFSFIGTIEQPHDPRGFSIGYLKSGDTVLEVFTYEPEKTFREPQLDVAGFAYAELAGDPPPNLTSLTAPDGSTVYVDPDGFAFSREPYRMKSPSSDDWLRPLGATGLTVSAVCAGGALLAGMPEVFGYDVTRAEAVAVVRSVFKSPLRWIDTSNGYGDGESELRIGQAITEHGGLPDGFLVATKVDADGKDYSGARVRASVAESKQRLGLQQLPLVYLHDPEFHDFESMRDAVDTLMRLRDEGEIGHVGLAGGNVHELARYLDLGGFEVVLVHNRWSLVDHSAHRLIEQALSQGIAVINAAIYGGGILANPQGGSKKYGYRDAPAATLEAVALMDKACRDYGIDLGTAALQHSVNDPRITGTVVGFSKPARLEQLISSLETEIPDELQNRLTELMPDKQHWLQGTP